MFVRKETSLRTQRNSCNKIFSIPHLFLIILQSHIFSKKKIIFAGPSFNALENVDPVDNRKLMRIKK